MFFQGERGRYIGFYALALTNGVSLFPPLIISDTKKDPANTLQ